MRPSSFLVCALGAANFTSTSCFCFKFCLLQILICFVFAFTQLNIPFLFPLKHPLWLMCYINTYSSVSKCLEILLLAFCYWFLVWFFGGWRMCSVAFQCFSICWGLFNSPGSILVCVLWVLEKNVYSADTGWNVL